MKKIIAMLLLIFSVTYSSAIYASAAEKWDYEVKPDTNQKVKLTGHKVDQYGSPANDYKYETTIDPKTASNRTKMGTVAINKLLKRANWAITGVELFQTFLEGIDWVIDPAAQSIWRYKQTDTTSVNCGGGYLFRYQNGEWKSCPIDAITPYLEKNSNQYVKYEFYKFDVNPFDASLTRITFTVSKKSSTSTELVPNQTLERKVDPNALPPEKEYLTPDAAADYANHTHPDFTNPKYSPRADTLYKPEIQTDLWKPHNEWEYENSPTVQEAKQRLAEAQPVPKDDKIKENEPDPETGAKSFSLPAFCSWATSVCEFIDWMKEKPEQEQEQDLPDIDDQDIFSKEFDYSFSLSNQCPPDIPLKLESQLLSGNFTFSMKWLCIIFTALGYPIVFASHCLGVWILYEAATRKQIKW